MSECPVRRPDQRKAFLRLEGKFLMMELGTTLIVDIIQISHENQMPPRNRVIGVVSFEMPFVITTTRLVMLDADWLDDAPWHHLVAVGIQRDVLPRHAVQQSYVAV